LHVLDRTGVARWALFGVGYAAASLACTFGVLLAVIAQAQATSGVPGQAWVFTAYAAGSITLLLILSAAAVLAGTALRRAVRTLGRWQARVTAALLLLTGGYVAAYWWPVVTGHAPVGHGLSAIDQWSATISTWLQAHTSQSALTAAAIVTLASTAGVIAHARRRKAAALSAAGSSTSPSSAPTLSATSTQESSCPPE